MHSLANNKLVGETGYIKKSEVSGDSFEVGSVVKYQGRQMTVCQAPDSHAICPPDNIKMLDVSGLVQLANALPQTKLERVKCVVPAKSGRWKVWPTSVSSH